MSESYTNFILWCFLLYTSIRIQPERGQHRKALSQKIVKGPPSLCYCAIRSRHTQGRMSLHTHTALPDTNSKVECCRAKVFWHTSDVFGTQHTPNKTTQPTYCQQALLQVLETDDTSQRKSQVEIQSYRTTTMGECRCRNPCWRAPQSGRQRARRT